MEKWDKVSDYIRNSWLKSVMKKDSTKDFPLPYDYIPPSISAFQRLFYWDTYFTNIGLYIDGLKNYAFNNIEDLKYCLRKFGCVPNYCTATGSEVASQPPLLWLMIKDYFEQTHDKDFLKDSFLALEIEYDFWMSKRIAYNGLNHYGTNWDYISMTEDEVRLAVLGFANRVGLDVSSWTIEQMRSSLINRASEGESGEDHTPRFGGKASEICALDLNCILYGFEKNMAEFAAVLGKNDLVWIKRAEVRKSRINRYCLEEKTGVYFDYNFKTGERTGIFCCACYLPYLFGLTDNKEALSRINSYLVCPFGVISCQEIQNVTELFQWGYPNAWAPHQFYAYKANKLMGNEEKAKEIAEKWLNVVADEFVKTGKLFEKYDAIVGGKATIDEYGTPEMMGWTAGVFKYFYIEM